MSRSAPFDVVSDNVTDAAKRLGITVPILFFRAAKHCRDGKGFSNNGEVGEGFYRIWVKQGQTKLPPAVQLFVLEVNEGQHTGHGCPECQSTNGCAHSH